MIRWLELIALCSVAYLTASGALEVPSGFGELAVDAVEESWPGRLMINPLHGIVIKRDIKVKQLGGQFIKPAAIETDTDVMIRDFCTEGFFVETPVDLVDALYPRFYPIRFVPTGPGWSEYCLNVPVPPAVSDSLWRDD